jgi:hypothetical protein
MGEPGKPKENFSLGRPGNSQAKTSENISLARARGLQGAKGKIFSRARFAAWGNQGKTFLCRPKWRLAKPKENFSLGLPAGRRSVAGKGKFFQPAGA